MKTLKEKKKDRSRNEKGVALLALVFVIMVLAMASYAFVGIVSEEKLSISEPRESIQALYIAEASAQIGKMFAREMLQQGIDPSDGGEEGYYYRYEDEPLCGGTFDLGLELPWNTESFTLSVTGYFKGNQRTLKMHYAPDHGSSAASLPGVLADDWLTFKNNAYIDSYDSREEAWQGKGVEENGHALSNCKSTTQVGFRVYNNANIYGNACVTTPEADEDILVGNNGEIHGDEVYNASEWQFKAITVPAGLDYTEEGDPKIEGEIGKHGDYEISNNSFILKNNGDATFHAGTYRFAGFECSNNANLIIAGPCEIYLEGSLVLENNAEILPPIEITGDSTYLRVYYMGTQTVDLSNNLTFYGFIYAPNAKIEVKNNDAVFGALVGKEVYIWNNAGLHYDEALGDEYFGNVLGPPIPPLTRYSWQEVF